MSATINGVPPSSGTSPTSSQTNTEWTRPTVSTLKVAPRDGNLPAFVTVADSAGVSSQVTIPAAGLTWSIAIADDGAIGGRRVAEAEAADRVHDVYVVAKSGGASPGTISEVSGTALTHAALAAIDSTYVLLSTIQWSGRNASSALLDFVDEGHGVCTLKTAIGWDALSGGTTQPAVTAIDLTDLVPDGATTVYMMGYFINAQATVRNCQFWADAAGTAHKVHIIDGVSTAAANTTDKQSQFRFPITGALTASLHYALSGAVTTGLFVHVMGWRIPR